MANVVIDIAAEFTGNKAFKQAETSTDKLVKNVKKLAGAAGLAFGTAQVIAFGKASVKAALDAQAQQERLASLVKVTVGASQLQIQSLNDQAAALQDIGVVSKENITQTQSQLATFNLQIDTIKQLTPAILDYVTAEKGAAASADQFKQMTNGLAQALNGNFASLTKVGFVLDEATKKTIKNGTESERAAALVAVLDSTYKDFNKNLAKTDAGQMQILANAANDAQEIIGTGLLDAVKMLGDDDSVANLATAMQDVATYTADAIRGVGVLIDYLRSIPGANILIDAFKVFNKSTPLGLLVELGKQARQNAEQQGTNSAALAHLAELESKYKIKSLGIARKLTAEELKKLKAAKLKSALDKANLALGKGESVFDIDKIQMAAALTNQAQLLGKATEASQILQIANDTARLNVKRSILALEDAIASKDTAAIIAATAKLNEDLKILGALTNQKTQMVAIESILKGLTPTDLINQDNLDEALRKIRLMLEELAKIKTPTITPPSSGGGGGGGGGGGFIQTPNGIRPTTEPRSIAEINKATEALGGVISVIGENGKEFTKLVDGLPPVFQTVEDAGAFNALVNSFANGAMNPFNAGSFRAAEGGSLFNSGAVGSRDRDININVQTGIGDPEAIARAIEDAIRQANQRGTTSLSIL
jgi:hypothetical protein